MSFLNLKPSVTLRHSPSESLENSLKTLKTAPGRENATPRSGAALPGDSRKTFLMGAQHSQPPEQKGASSKTSSEQQPGSPSATLKPDSPEHCKSVDPRSVQDQSIRKRLQRGWGPEGACRGMARIWDSIISSIIQRRAVRDTHRTSHHRVAISREEGF